MTADSDQCTVMFARIQHSIGVWEGSLAFQDITLTGVELLRQSMDSRAGTASDCKLRVGLMEPGIWMNRVVGGIFTRGTASEQECMFAHSMYDSAASSHGTPNAIRNANHNPNVVEPCPI